MPYTFSKLLKRTFHTLKKEEFNLEYSSSEEEEKEDETSMNEVMEKDTEADTDAHADTGVNVGADVDGDAEVQDGDKRRKDNYEELCRECNTERIDMMTIESEEAA